jgi:hypothetical protein
VSVTFLSSDDGREAELEQLSWPYLEQVVLPDQQLVDDDALRRAHAHVFYQVSRSNGIAGAIGFFLQQALTVDDANLAVGLQMELGPAPTTYLETAHIGKFWMRDRFLPAIADIAPYDEWVKRGRPDIVSEARAKVEEVRARHTPLPLERDQPQAIEDVSSEARQHCRHSGLISYEEWELAMQTLSDAGHVVTA